MEAPKIYDISVKDKEDGVRLTFSLDEGLVPTETSQLYVKARIHEADYFQTLSYDVLPGGKMADTIIEPGKVIFATNGKPEVSLIFYLETYPEREKSEVLSKIVTFEPDWFGLPPFEHELRSLFERKGIEMQAQEAAQFDLVDLSDIHNLYSEFALDNSTGLWMVEKDSETVGISPDQPSEGYAWRGPWFEKVLKRSRQIRSENDD